MKGIRDSIVNDDRIVEIVVNVLCYCCKSLIFIDGIYDVLSEVGNLVLVQLYSIMFGCFFYLGRIVIVMVGFLVRGKMYVFLVKLYVLFCG